MRKLRTLLTVYRDAGGRMPIVLCHDEDHGTPLIDALARYGDGLPANVLPLAVNEVTQVGLEAIAAAFAYGASAFRFLMREKPRHDLAGLIKTIALAQPILNGLGFSGHRIATVETDGPIHPGRSITRYPDHRAGSAVGKFSAGRSERDVLRQAIRELHGVAPAPVDVIALPTGADLGQSKSISKDARFAWPVYPPVQPARCRLVPNSRCYVSPKMPAYSAGYARRRVRKT